MKKAIKIILSIIGIALLCLMILGQIVRYAAKSPMETVSEKSDFARMIERADKDCPIPVAMGEGAVTGIKLENNYVTYYLSYNHKFTNILNGQTDDKKIKEGLLMSLLCLNAQGNNQGDLLMDLLTRFDYGLKVVINQSSTDRFECSAAADEIRALRERYQINPHEALYNLLSLNIEAERANLPIKLDEGMMMTNYRLEDDNIVIVIALDDDIYSLSNMSNNIGLMKATIMEELCNDAEIKALLDMCKASHTGLVYRYVGVQSHMGVDVEISSDEIRRIVKTPDVVNIQ